MRKHIIVKTDASVNPDKGVGLGYKATVHKDNGGRDTHKGSHYIPRNMKTTRAEFLASTFAVREVYEEIKNECGDYRLIVETDCDKTVKIFNKKDPEKKLHRTLNFLGDFFDSTTVRWISRSNNKTADAIARSTMERGWRESQ